MIEGNSLHLSFVSSKHQ